MVEFSRAVGSPLTEQRDSHLYRNDHTEFTGVIDEHKGKSKSRLAVRYMLTLKHISTTDISEPSNI